MELKDAIKSCFRRYATFKGRSRRSEFWFFVLFNYIVGAILSFVSAIVIVAVTVSKVVPMAMAGTITEEAVESAILAVPVTMLVLYGIIMLYSLAMMVPNLAVTWRRLHDIGKSGAYFFISWIPLVGPILMLIWLCRDSQPGTNQFGPNPKEPVPWEY